MRRSNDDDVGCFIMVMVSFGVGSVFDFVLDFFDLILCDPLTLDVQGSHCSFDIS